MLWVFGNIRPNEKKNTRKTERESLERQTEDLQRSVQQFRLSQNDAPSLPGKGAAPAGQRRPTPTAAGDEWVAF